jgi:hypothetical protein
MPAVPALALLAIIPALAAVPLASKASLAGRRWLLPVLGLAICLGVAGASVDARPLALALSAVAGLALFQLGCTALSDRLEPLGEADVWVGLLGGATLAAAGAAGRLGVLEGGALMLAPAAVAWLLGGDRASGRSPAGAGADAAVLLAFVAAAAALALATLRPALAPAAPIPLAILLAATLAGRPRHGDRPAPAPLLGAVALGAPLATGFAAIAAISLGAITAPNPASLPRLLAAAEALASRPSISGLEPLLWVGLATLAATALLAGPRHPRRTGLVLIALGASCAAPAAAALTTLARN